MPFHSSYPDDLCRRVTYWQSHEPLAQMISKLDQKSQNQDHKGFKDLTDQREQRDMCTTRQLFFFFSELPLVLVRRYRSDLPTSSYAFILPLNLLQGEEGSLVTAGERPKDVGNVHLHLFVQKYVIFFFFKGHFNFCSANKEYLIFSLAQFQLFVNSLTQKEKSEIVQNLSKMATLVLEGSLENTFLFVSSRYTSSWAWFIRNKSLQCIKATLEDKIITLKGFGFFS